MLIYDYLIFYYTYVLLWGLTIPIGILGFILLLFVWSFVLIISNSFYYLIRNVIIVIAYLALLLLVIIIFL